MVVPQTIQEAINWPFLYSFYITKTLYWTRLQGWARLFIEQDCHWSFQCPDGSKFGLYNTTDRHRRRRCRRQQVTIFRR